MAPTSTTSGSRLRLQLTESQLSTVGIQLIYAAGMVVWLIITMVLELWPQASKTSRVILIIPIALCIANIVTPIEGSQIVIDPLLEQNSLLTFILIASSILSPWLTVIIDRRRKYHVRIIKAFVVMLILLTFTQYGFFALRYVSDLETHIDTIINAMSLALLGYAVSEYLHSEYTHESVYGIDRVMLDKAAERNTLASGAQVNILNPRVK